MLGNLTAMGTWVVIMKGFQAIEALWQGRVNWIDVSWTAPRTHPQDAGPCVEHNCTGTVAAGRNV